MLRRSPRSKAIQDTGNRLIAAADRHDAVGILDRFSLDVRFFTEFERFDRHLEKRRRGPESERAQVPEHLFAHCTTPISVSCCGWVPMPFVKSRLSSTRGTWMHFRRSNVRPGGESTQYFSYGSIPTSSRSSSASCDDGHPHREVL